MVVLLLRHAADRGRWCAWDEASITFSTSTGVLSSPTCGRPSPAPATPAPRGVRARYRVVITVGGGAAAIAATGVENVAPAPSQQTRAATRAVLPIPSAPGRTAAMAVADDLD